MKKLTNLKDLIANFLKTNEETVNRYRLVLDWEKIVGKEIAKVARPYMLKNKILYIRVESHFLLTELSYKKNFFLQAFNKHHGAQVIEQIYLRVGKLPEIPSKDEFSKQPPFSLDGIELKKKEHISKKEIHDESLRDSFTKLKETWKKC